MVLEINFHVIAAFPRIWIIYLCFKNPQSVNSELEI